MKIPQGFSLASLNCGLKKQKPDLGLIQCQGFSKAVGFFTSNLNVSYSVSLSRKNISNPIKAVLVNSGNANCFSGKNGYKDTLAVVKQLAAKLGVSSSRILFVSTGIIGKPLPKGKIIRALDDLVNRSDNNCRKFAKSISTTDTFLKIAYSKATKAGGSILGFAKGAGMIAPNMATMLGFILTDVDISGGQFKKIAKQALEQSFNAITVDGCTSTNDTVFFLSSQRIKLAKKSQAIEFSKNLNKVSLALAKLIVKDGEGASKFIQIKIKGAKTLAEAQKAGLAIANSNLFKCAIYGADSNWGRIVQSLGQSGIKLDENFSVKASNLAKKDITIEVDLKRGKCAGSVYTCDLTPEYVKINAEYS
ncbi:MAG: bifunctional glutamate N-acetyltransferase/amino-acid acetyltransferase ArgJ [Candidatus Omnitrophica bacterium]|nr:bifunctional glutamate N-acetyltransferase/amino-acid acetyltransferase ArgJ [Candidatus Omnitrophota bacterium]MBU2044312.1 bifunctional glutamate N-acetyltransferase/amino-acid acetyltransferase ArgJ [Candidatus Omnitrophota bacterium]MBU2250926.1 bifunctional glutamate N-acetyltransferase/amino-acid acetyltransferase ArgJ [Candidatus Omnitrophota bacterium]MBU2265774.1 bifunctional glutamate N-acetyltransferase/amino-acid acetyltransferase ArgJ [Candidatus Omnitrophota bacterium]MBU247332